jgi:hypothetical protein
MACSLCASDPAAFELIAEFSGMQSGSMLMTCSTATRPPPESMLSLARKWAVQNRREMLSERAAATARATALLNEVFHLDAEMFVHENNLVDLRVEVRVLTEDLDRARAQLARRPRPA